MSDPAAARSPLTHGPRTPAHPAARADCASSGPALSGPPSSASATAEPAGLGGPTRRRRSALVAATLVVGGIPLSGLLVAIPSAAAEEATAAEVAHLAGRAPSDPAALERLRRVDRVDGRSVDLGRALAGAQGAELEARLRSLRTTGGAAAPPDGSTAAAEDARRILEGRRFNPSPVPRPFRGVLRRLGGWLRPVTGPLGRLWDDVAGNAVATGAAAAVVVGLAALVTARLVGRRRAAGVGHERWARTAREGDDPDALEARAAAAERAGDLERAVRLRFRAGLVRLHRAGAIVDRPALTTGQLTRQVTSARLRGLAATFEEVAYGRRPATADDVDAARAGWPRVLEEAGDR